MSAVVDPLAGLRNDASLLRLTLDWVPAGIAMLDRDMCYMAVSRRYLEDYGLAGQDLIGRSHYEVFPEMPERWRAVHRRCLAGAVESADGDSFVRADGRVEFYDWSCRPWRETGGAIGGIVLFTRDSTDEVLRRKAAQRLADAVGHCAFGIGIIDARDDRIIDVNPAYARMLGGTVEAVRGVALIDTYPPAQHDFAEAQFARADREGHALYESVRQRLDGSSFPAMMALSGKRADPDAIPYRVCTVMDTTESARAQEALRESEARMRFATESTGIGTWEVDVATGKATRSPRHAAIFGVPADGRWTDADFVRHVLPEDRPMVERQRRAGLAATHEWNMAFRIRRADDGAVRWLEARGTPLPDALGRITRFVGIVVDITERKHAEELLARHAEVLEQRVAERTGALAEANERLRVEMREREVAQAALVQAHRLEAIGQIVGGVAHSYNNLLASMIGNLELLGLAVPLAERPQRLLGRALASAWQGGALTEKLLAYARQQNVSLRPVDLGEVVASARPAIREAAGQAVTVVEDAAPALWPACGDAAQIRTILLELVANACAAMRQGGRLGIGTRNLAADEPDLPPELPDGDYVLLRVSDTGPGMPPEVLARACEPFFTTHDVGGGAGLGLAQVDGIARQFGGLLRLASTRAGTTASVLLPRMAG